MYVWVEFLTFNPISRNPRSQLILRGGGVKYPPPPSNYVFFKIGT